MLPLSAFFLIELRVSVVAHPPAFSRHFAVAFWCATSTRRIKMKFSDLRLAEPILRAVAAEDYTIATPIQAESIPHILEGKDVLGSAQTGTGKTAAFALPILHRLASVKPAHHRARCLVLCPTRELAIQIGDSFRIYGKHLPLRSAVIFGGVSQHAQTDALRNGVDIIVATPGRLMDLMEQRLCDLRGIEILVLDEADRMLDMGFIIAIRKIVAALRAQRQTLLFSATMPSEIRRLANDLLHNPAVVQVAHAAATTAQIEESVYFVERQNKAALLAHLFNSLPMARALVFTRTKHGADRAVRHLHTRGIRAEAIHGNKTQNARKRALDNFRNGKTPVLVATDIASRGIDIDNITHVVNYDLTHEPETYVHRIGRTGRAGATGAAVSFCDPDERANLRAIQTMIRRNIPVKTDHPTYAAAAPGKASESHASHSNARSHSHAQVHAPKAAVAHKHQPREKPQRRAHPLHGKPHARRQHSFSGGRGR
jgi:ATP-dependent RNA helicase RhlE